jgi:acyl-CoA thioesterase
LNTHEPVNAQPEEPDLILHPFDEAIALERLADGSFQGHTSARYANMVGPFGGIVAAQMLQAVMLHPQRLGAPTVLTINFATGLQDGPFEVLARPARTNRSTQHWQLEIKQSGESALIGTAMTAVRRPTWSDTEHRMPSTIGPQEVARNVPSVPMEWVKRYDMRFVKGALPVVWDGRLEPDSLSQQWMRDDPPRPLDFCALAALADVFFIRLFSRRATRSPVGTVSMTVYFHADAAQLALTGTGFLLGQAVGQQFRDGYFDQSAQLWNEAGDLLATTSQLVYFRD